MITTKPFGTLPDGRTVQSYRIDGADGAYVELLDYGATLQSVVVPDKNGALADIVQGFDTLEGHLLHSDYQGQTVGRYANRIGGGFSLAGQHFAPSADENGVTLHGGGEFSHALWTAEILDEHALTLRYTSPAGAFGFPGTVQAAVTFCFEDGALIIDYYAQTDAPTVLGLTNHAYWNLRGHGDILAHTLQADAHKFQPGNALLLPEGDPQPVDNTPFDFRIAKAIGHDIAADHEQLRLAGGYDHHFVLHPGGEVRVFEPESRRVLSVCTDKPGFQLYTGNFLSGKPGKGGVPLEKHTGFCIETQFPPDSPNTRAADCVFTPTRPYRSRTVYAFGVLG
ncbi:MAG: galactose mutarotase [Oscillospiraceae bacterium]|jgi:aldose 1-epimerase|nr:galactose mutarotase [Oscillospiraceae bacterium]